MFTAYENEHECLGNNIGMEAKYGWNKATYETKEECAKYLHKWLGSYSPGIEHLMNHNYELYGTTYKIEEK